MLEGLYAKLSTHIEQHHHVPQSVRQYVVMLLKEYMNHQSQNALLHNLLKFSNSLPESQLFMLDKKK